MKNNKLTENDVHNSYEFLIACNMINQQFPWIKECVVDSKSFANEKYKTTIWVDFIIDPIEVMKTYGWQLANYVPIIYYDNNQTYKAGPSTMFEIPWEEGNKIMNEIRTIYIESKDNVAIPDELKLPYEKYLAPGQFIIPPGYEI